MPTRVIVDGSNLATEGRTEPSLAQLDEAVREFQKEHPKSEITVVVDSTFGHRINESERRAFEEAELAGEIVSPPAGAIGRGDAFVLRIADKVGATVLSNDSFQEFHGEHEWLFDKGRLIGGKPVPGIGWIFTPRSPVRGPRSRQAVRAAKMGAPPVPDKPPPRPRKAAAEKSKRATKPKVVEQAIKVAVDEAVEPSSAKKRRRRSAAPPTEPVNDPLTFVTFIAEHHPGTVVRGEVESFSSHGAFIRVGMARCYLALADMADPPPAAARQVLTRGEQGRFLVKAFDPPRRGIELSLMGIPEEGREPASAAAKPAAPKKAATKKRAAAPKKAATKKVPAPKKAAAPKKATTKKKAAAVKKTATKKVTAPKKAATKKAAPAKKATKTAKKAAKKAR
jgi:hypothetical protein